MGRVAPIVLAGVAVVAGLVATTWVEGLRFDVLLAVGISVALYLAMSVAVLLGR